MKRFLAITALVISCSHLLGCGGGSGGGDSGGNAPAKFTVGGSVAGLAASTQVTLLNNGEDALVVSSSGAFTFPSTISSNGNYAVTVGNQPTGQTCTVTNGTGSGATSNISNVQVNCSAITYTIGGSVSGLSSGTQVVIQNNSSDATTITSNGSFNFATPVAYSGSYAVIVLTQPPGQTCTITNGTGSGVTANVSNVSIACHTNTYTVGGTVSGLNNGQQVTLQNNSADPITLVGNGTFTFSTPVAYNGSYVVTVGTQPTGQTCSVSSGAGSNVNSNIANVEIACSTNTFRVGGTVSGLNTGLQVTLLNNGSDAKTVNGNGSFEFSTQVGYGGVYLATVATQPVGQACSVTNGSGTVTSTVLNIAISCSNRLGKFAYAANYFAGTISGYLINNSTGMLTAQSGSPYGALLGLSGLVAHPNGKYLFASSSNSSAPVSVYSISATNGALSLVGSYDNGGGAYSVATDSEGRFVFIPDADGYVVSYTVNQTTGALTFVGAYASGTSPVGVVVDPSSRFVYVLNQTSGNVSAYSLNASTGVLTFIANYTAGTGGQAFGITVDPGGKFLYTATNRNSHNVQQFSINQTTGALSYVVGYGANIPVTDSVTINPTGEFLYNVYAGDVIAYTRNSITGALTLVGTYANGGSGGNALTVDPLNKYAYVPNKGSNDVSILTINQSSGALTAGTPVAAGTYTVSVAISREQQN